MKRFLLAVVLAAAPALHAAQTTVTILHFSDYHSHALPFYSEDRPRQGGIARAIGYLRAQKRRGALVFSGGDTVNKGAPAWSDKYQCAEWPWFDGIVDAMALGNHDADYGAEAFRRCRASIGYPILSANAAEGGTRFLPSKVFTRGGIRIGVFAVAGPDFPTLVKTAGFSFDDPVAAARETVRRLRDVEHVDAVISIGHESIDDDFALARAVPGIDVIFGTHSHLKRDLQRIDGTSTWFVSPFQYLTYISRVQLVFRGHKLAGVRGGLVRVDESLPIDANVAKRVASMQRALERDPQYAELFRVIGTTPKAISLDALGPLVMNVVREAAKADVALSTSSSFRQAIDGGPITMEELRASLPYDNEIVVYDVSGELLAKLLAFSESRRNTDFFAQIAGVTSVDPAKRYRVATTDYLAKVAPGYREFFSGLTPETTGLRVREQVRKWFASRGGS